MLKIRQCMSTLAALAVTMPLFATPALAFSTARPQQGASLASLPPFQGTSQITFLQVPEGAPARAINDLGSYVVNSSWLVADPQHFRVGLRTLSPSMEAGTQTVVANGATLLWYDARVGAAVRGPLGPVSDLMALGLFQGGESVGVAQMRGLSIVDYYRSNGGTVKVLGQEQVLGRATDVVEVGPIVLHETKTCLKGKPCTITRNGYGTERVWFDRELGIVLREEQHGIPASIGFATNFMYRVTSLTVGQGATAADLAYKPPVPVKGPPTGDSGSIEVGKTLKVPSGFIRFKAPRGYALQRQPWATSPLTGKTYSFSALFTKSRHFFYVQERVHMDGLPASLKNGTLAWVGMCRVRTGRYRDSLRWLSLHSRHITLLATSDELSTAALKKWITTVPGCAARSRMSQTRVVDI